jgi:hypothetical protein
MLDTRAEEDVAEASGCGNQWLSMCFPMCPNGRPPGAMFFDVVAKAPWAVESPPRERIQTEILLGAEHLIEYRGDKRGLSGFYGDVLTRN